MRIAINCEKEYNNSMQWGNNAPANIFGGKMKKFSILLAVVLVFVCAATVLAKDANGLIVVGYAQLGAESDWRTANTKSFKETFTEANGYKLEFDDAQQKQENQIKAIRNFIQEGVDYIVLAPVVETGWDDVLGEAKTAGIPVIVADRTVKVADDSLYTVYVGGDMLEEGRKCVKWLEDYLSKNELGKKSEIDIALMQGTIGSTAEIGRTQGVEEGIKANPTWKEVEKQTGEFTQSKGQEVMESWLKSGQNIDVLICENDNMALGAIDAIKAAGKVPGKDIVIIGFDAIKAAFEAMKAGDMNCTVECNPLYGPRVAEIIQKLEKGETVDKVQHPEEGVFPADEVTDEQIASRVY